MGDQLVGEERLHDVIVGTDQKSPDAAERLRPGPDSTLSTLS
jgi:hypothetical protein